jgi:putative acetyltransferase
MRRLTRHVHYRTEAAQLRPLMPIEIRVDDLSSPEVQALVAEHLAGMRGNSPPGSVYALELAGLKHPQITFWSAWEGDALCGCGALKQLDARAGEVKSMRTRPACLRRGVGQAVLNRIIESAVARGYGTLHLETGTGPAFEAAHALYLRNGFVWSGPFGDYEASGFNVFMTMNLGGVESAA